MVLCDHRFLIPLLSCALSVRVCLTEEESLANLNVSHNGNVPASLNCTHHNDNASGYCVCNETTSECHRQDEGNDGNTSVSSRNHANYAYYVTGAALLVLLIVIIVRAKSQRKKLKNDLEMARRRRLQERERMRSDNDRRTPVENVKGSSGVGSPLHVLPSQGEQSDEVKAEFNNISGSILMEKHINLAFEDDHHDNRHIRGPRDSHVTTNILST
ncbi:uncharacterized protein [Ptychodera flava]|uniref:uncharacterized protein n=1 Tax=Ptychodera flava TaxID=63121 RepID=UPI00396A69EA